jgi:hypothetical protein
VSSFRSSPFSLSLYPSFLSFPPLLLLYCLHVHSFTQQDLLISHYDLLKYLDLNVPDGDALGGVITDFDNVFITPPDVKPEDRASVVSNAIMRVMDGKLNYKQKNFLKPMVDAVERTTDLVQSPLAVVVVGAGPIALRTAIELALIGCHVSILERQPPGVIDSRPNMLKLWDWTFQDLKRLGVPTQLMQGKGNKHIGCDDLQLSLLRVALILGCDFYPGTTYLQSATRPGTHAEDGWIAICKQGDKELIIAFDVLVGAGGARCRTKKEFGFENRSIKLANAVGLVCFFEKNITPAQKKLEEVLWARQFNKPPLLDKMQDKNIDMENLVFFKGHNVEYVVCTPMMSTLVGRGVLPKKNTNLRSADPENLGMYARDVATFVGIAKDADPVGRHPVSLFDFSERVESMKAMRVLDPVPGNPEGALVMLVGDALIEPFWPEGTGVNRGFLSALDAAHTLTKYRKYKTEDVELWRDAMFQAQRRVQANDKNALQDDYKKYFMDPFTRYKGGVFAPRTLAAKYEKPTPPNEEDVQYAPAFNENNRSLLHAASFSLAKRPPTQKDIASTLKDLGSCTFTQEPVLAIDKNNKVVHLADTVGTIMTLLKARKKFMAKLLRAHSRGELLEENNFDEVHSPAADVDVMSSVDCALLPLKEDDDILAAPSLPPSKGKMNGPPAPPPKPRAISHPPEKQQQSRRNSGGRAPPPPPAKPKKMHLHPAQSHLEQKTLVVPQHHPTTHTETASKSAMDAKIKMGRIRAAENVHMQPIAGGDEVDDDEWGDTPSSSSSAAAVSAAPAAAITPGTYSIEVLQREAGDLPDEVDLASREMWLSDADFQTLFYCKKDAFQKLPAWKRKNMKRDAGFF